MVRSTPAFTESGWLENPTGFIQQCTQTAGKPAWFTAYVRNNGTLTCQPGTTFNDGTVHSYSVHDNNLDGNWVLEVDNSPKLTPDLGTFTTGQPIANAERRVSTDPNRVDIPNLQRMDASQAWVSYDSPLTVTDNDPSWNACPAALQNFELHVSNTC